MCHISYHTFFDGYTSVQSRVVVDGVVDGIKGDVDVGLVGFGAGVVGHGLN